MLDAAKTAIKRLVIRSLRNRDRARRARAGFNGLTPDLWGYRIDGEGNLEVEGLAAVDIARRFGTPLYVVSLPWLRKTHAEFIGPFRSRYPNVQLATSYKTNPVPAVLAALHECGTYAEVISEFELWLAERLGLPGERIILNGPGKTPRMLERAVQIGAKAINIDNPAEIEIIAAAAARHGTTQAVGVRVVTSVGWSSQFGLPLDTGDAFTAFERIRSRPELVPSAVHLHIGTGVKSVDAYARAIAEVLEFASQLRRELGIELALYDLGGGFGVPTVRSGDVWDDRMEALGYPAREAFPAECPTPEDYADCVTRLFRDLADGPSPPEIVLEPGRAITSGAQTLLLSVLGVKTIHGKRKLILDGGKNITLPLGWENHKIFPAAGLHRPADAPCDLFGPLCHPGDIVGRNLSLPALDVGEVIAIMDAGAYFVPNQMNFSNPRPGIVLVENGRARWARRPESFEDIVRLDEIECEARTGR